jgi:uncharacterized protein (TIGR03435 family)
MKLWTTIRSSVRASASVLIACAALLAQPAGRPKFEEFEVATVKPAAPDATGRYIRMQSAHQFTAWNQALLTLIAAAYNVSRQSVFGGPAWVESDHYNIVAKAPNDVRPIPDEQMGMLAKLLAERFKLSFHREKRELSIYTLTLAKGGAKLKESTDSLDAHPEGSPPLIFVVSPPLIRLPAKNATMAAFASVLQRSALDRPVVDRTGLTGRYDFNLEFTPDESLFDGTLGKGDLSKPGLFAALQEQMGLKLERGKGPVDVIVIDHAERPVEN